MATSTPLKPLWDGFSYKEHQVIGINWMLKRESAARGGLLADEMGLGKTIQMAGLLKNGQRKVGEQVLLAAPVAVLEQWKAVLRRCGCGVYVPAPKGFGWRFEQAAVAPIDGAPQVHILGYERIQRTPALVQLYQWDRAIFDEAHRLLGAKVYEIVSRELRAQHIWLLTATPVINSMKDLKRLFALLGIETVVGADMKPAIHEACLARTMDQLRDTLPDAPPRPEFETLTLDFVTEDEAAFYRGIQGILSRRFRAIAEEGRGDALAKLQLFMKLRQISLHPQVYIAAQKARLKKLYTRPDWNSSSTKFEKLRELVGGGEGAAPARWIIFCHFRQEMDLLEKALAEVPTVERIQSYHGSLTAAQKTAVVERTHEPLAAGKSEVLLVQLQSGGTGLNLQHFNRVVFTGPWWTEALMSQAVGRAVRIGQHEVVRVYHLVLREEATMNIDAVMREKAAQKGSLCRAVLAAATTTVSVTAGAAVA